MDINAFIKTSVDLEAKHIEAAVVIRKLRISVGLRHHFGLPMDGRFGFRVIQKFRSSENLLEVTNHNGHPIKQVKLNTIPKALWPAIK